MSPTPKRLVLATRGSRLALRQTEIVSEALLSRYPSIEIEVRTVRTTGDRDQRPYRQIGGKGLFTTEVERQVVEGRADAAVHSAKDLTSELGRGCEIACVLPRSSAHDVVVGGQGGSGEERLAALPSGARVGTSSLRRRSLLAEMRPDLDVAELRGNLDTRLRKVAEGEVAAAILAAAGLERLGLSDGSYGPLSTDRWIPAPAQGALVVEVLTERADVKEVFESIDEPRARVEVTCERAFSDQLEGGCSIPLGCLARADGTGGRVIASAFLGLPDGSQTMRDRISGGAHEAEALGRELANAMLSGGGRDILSELSAYTTPEVIEP
jgi:hydroxymethylbilane synthase